MKKLMIALYCVVALTAFAWKPGEPIPEKIAPIKAPFDMPQLQRPKFQDKTFSIEKYGAKQCKWGATPLVKSTDAIKEAIAACNKAGGGKVLIPKGDWVTGAVHLKSNVNLHLEEGATLHFSDNPKDYLPVVYVRWEGVECYNYSPLVYAPNCENIAITGKGTLNGHGKKWWPFKKRSGRNRVAAAKQPLEKRKFGYKAGVTSQRPVLLCPWKSKNVLIEGVTLIDPPFWTVQPVYCENVIIRGITVNSRKGPNGDGIDIDSCKNVLIEYNDLKTNDDAVCLKSGLNEDGMKIGIPTENVVVRNFLARDVKTGSGGIVVGSEMSGGVRNIYVHDAHFERCDRGIRFKSCKGRGGVVENCWFENITMKDIRRQSFNINTAYDKQARGKAPLFQKLFLKNIKVEGTSKAIDLIGLPDKKFNTIEVVDSTFTGAKEGAAVKNATGVRFKNVKIQSNSGSLTLIGVSDSTFEDVDLNGKKPMQKNCKNVTIK
ncbi:MAG: glycoside hydrolase family 28 protein [Kiritimatiellae bacterium]|nr:glycoside hydrolase family 28 protein [Kiritimatiellia bacterium]